MLAFMSVLTSVCHNFVRQTTQRQMTFKHNLNDIVKETVHHSHDMFNWLESVTLYMIPLKYEFKSKRNHMRSLLLCMWARSSELRYGELL